MKAYGVEKGDSPRDCTDRGKYGSTKIPNGCSCGRKHGKKSRDYKNRKAKERNFKIELDN